MRVSTALLLTASVLGGPWVWTGAARSAVQSEAREQASVVLSRSLPRLNGDHLQAKVVEVRYGPGESSSQHSHPCPVVGYVVAGAYRTQVKGESEKIYKAGETFYEAPNGVHLVSANASSTQPVKFIACFICDHDTPLSVPTPDSKTEGIK